MADASCFGGCSSCLGALLSATPSSSSGSAGNLEGSEGPEEGAATGARVLKQETSVAEAPKEQTCDPMTDEVVKGASQELVVTFQAGTAGLQYCVQTGLVRSVVPDSQAERAGVKAGCTIIKVDGCDFSDNSFRTKAAGTCSFIVSFATGDWDSKTRAEDISKVKQRPEEHGGIQIGVKQAGDAMAVVEAAKKETPHAAVAALAASEPAGAKASKASISPFKQVDPDSDGVVTEAELNKTLRSGIIQEKDFVKQSLLSESTTPADPILAEPVTEKVPIEYVVREVYKEVPRIEHIERFVEKPEVHFVDVEVEVEKVEYRETVIEVPEIEYRERVIEKIVPIVKEVEKHVTKVVEQEIGPESLTKNMPLAALCPYRKGDTVEVMRSNALWTAGTVFEIGPEQMRVTLPETGPDGEQMYKDMDWGQVQAQVRFPAGTASATPSNSSAPATSVSQQLAALQQARPVAPNQQRTAPAGSTAQAPTVKEMGQCPYQEGNAVEVLRSDGRWTAGIVSEIRSGQMRVTLPEMGPDGVQMYKDIDLSQVYAQVRFPPARAPLTTSYTSAPAPLISRQPAVLQQARPVAQRQQRTALASSTPQAAARFVQQR